MTPALAIVAVYLLVLIVLGIAGRRQRSGETMRDFYLANNSLGFFVLLSTLYASQYSGNTFLGYTGQSYATGFGFLMSVGMMMSVVLVYLLFAPRLHAQAHRHGFVTPADWVRRRFGDRRLALLVTLLMIAALLNYLYAQFLAMGHMAVGLSGGRVPFVAGVIGLAVVIGIYETLGGMRSVAWTDVLQGVMLFVGLLIVLAAVLSETEGLSAVTRELQNTHPRMIAVPEWRQCARWASSLLLLGFGSAVYPHALQRIYAARDSRSLQRSLRVMICMPLFTVLVVVVIGVLARDLIPEQHGLATDRVMPELLAQLARDGILPEWVVALVLTAALAAMMSTADSALLSLSSMLARDVLGEWRPDLGDKQLARAGKWLSWGLIAVVVALALRPPTTLWRLIEIKMELLVQASPLFLLGVHTSDLDSKTAWRAVSVGTALAIAAFAADVDSVGGIHAGTLACAVNLAICLAGIRRNRRAQVALAQ